MKIKRLVNCFIPVSVCNFDCRYCYVPQVEGRKKNKMPDWRCAPEEIRKALSVSRLEGTCFMNICGDGETLIPKEVPEIIRNLLLEGHVLEVVTNGVLSERFDEILAFDSKLLERLEFKFSYHYEQLKNRGLLDVFWNNVLRARNRGCSFTIELVPHDELIPLIDEIKLDCISHVGALCHVTTTYDYSNNMKINSKLSEEEFIKTWGQFDSPMFDFKMSLIHQKRNEYCYAGEYLMSVDLATGEAHQCYFGRKQNIFENVESPLKWNAVGKNCYYPICFNAHALLVFGAIPKLAQGIYYTDIRNRTCGDGSEWLKEPVKSAFQSKFIDSNLEYSGLKKIINAADLISQEVCQKIKRMVNE